MDELRLKVVQVMLTLKIFRTLSWLSIKNTTFITLQSKVKDKVDTLLPYLNLPFPLDFMPYHYKMSRKEILELF